MIRQFLFGLARSTWIRRQGWAISAMERKGGRVEGYRYCFIDKTGNFATDQRYEYAGRFSEGLAFVILRGQAGYIDKTWKMVFTLQAAAGGEFSEGLAPVQVDQKWGYIDRT